MKILHRIGPRISSNWNTIAEIVDCKEPLSFDGVYTEVYDHYRQLKGKDITFFVSGKYAGGDNSFDLHSGERPGRFCTWDQIIEMSLYLDATVGFHGWEHRKCVGLSEDTLVSELAFDPFRKNNLRGNFKSILAWPHGVCDQAAIDVAKKLGYTEAWCAGGNGDGSEFQRKRSYLNW